MSKNNSNLHQHDYEKESQHYYDRIAGNFDQSWDGFLSSFFKRYIVRQLEIPKGAELLDIGCANGKLLSMLAKSASFRGTGLDISEKMVLVAQTLHPEFKFVADSALDMPFEGNSFDLLICSASFHHFPDPSRFLAEASRLLREEGRLVIAEIRIPCLSGLYNRFITRNSNEGDVKIYKRQELQEIFRENNWKIEKVRISRQIQYYELKKLPSE